MADCACGTDWVVEACAIKSGVVRSILHPISMDFQTDLNSAGQGTLTLATKDVLIRDIWPHLTIIYISRVTGGGGASQTNPIAEFAGIITQVSASESGTTQVGMDSIEYYLSRRTVKDSFQYDNPPQTEIGAGLVGLAEPGGIQLTATAEPSTELRIRTFNSWERKQILEAVMQLTQVRNGPDWELVHTRESGAWSSEMIFRDFVGRDTGITLQSDVELSSYSLEIDADDHATWVDAIGSGEEEDQLIVTVIDNADIYPEYDATPAWKSVTRVHTLTEHALGYLDDHREPRATPTFGIAGFDPSPSDLKLGDICDVQIDFGAITYHGPVRIISISWSLTDGEPTSRTFETVPLVRASESVLNQVPDETCRDC